MSISLSLSSNLTKVRDKVTFAKEDETVAETAIINRVRANTIKQNNLAEIDKIGPGLSIRSRAQDKSVILSENQTIREIVNNQLKGLDQEIFSEECSHNDTSELNSEFSLSEEKSQKRIEEISKILGPNKVVHHDFLQKNQNNFIFKAFIENEKLQESDNRLRKDVLLNKGFINNSTSFSKLNNSVSSHSSISSENQSKINEIAKRVAKMKERNEKRNLESGSTHSMTSGGSNSKDSSKCVCFGWKN